MADVSVVAYTKEKIEALIGETIVSVRLANGRNLIFATKSGVEIDAGDVSGFKMANPTAENLPSSPTGAITATTAQAALAKLATDFDALNRDKLRPNQVRKILSGQVEHISDFDQNGGATARIDCRYTNIFPPGYFLTPPRVVITPIPTDRNPNDIAAGWSARSITTRSFSINAHSQGTTTGQFIVPIPLPFYWVATSDGEVF